LPSARPLAKLPLAAHRPADWWGAMMLSIQAGAGPPGSRALINQRGGPRRSYGLGSGVRGLAPEGRWDAAGAALCAAAAADLELACPRKTGDVAGDCSSSRAGWSGPQGASWAGG